MATKAELEQALFDIAFYERDPSDYRLIAREALAKGVTTNEMAERIIKHLPEYREGCTCVGWCYFNPGQHHANCKCEAQEHSYRED